MTKDISEHEYLRQRIAIITQQLSKTDTNFVYVGDGKVDLSEDADDAATDHARKLRRELRLLRHLQRRTREGQVLKAAKNWRLMLSVSLHKHRQHYKNEQETYDIWRHLPPHQRERIPQPPKPPELWITDQNGERWLVNDRLLGVLDSICANLQKWLSVEQT
jgi:hypothetical protein